MLKQQSKTKCSINTDFQYTSPVNLDSKSGTKLFTLIDKVSSSINHCNN